MSNEGDIDKRQVGIRVDLDVCRKVEKKFSLPEDSTRSVAFIRALEEATRGVRLTAEDFKIIAAEAEDNLKKRIARRKEAGNA